MPIAQQWVQKFPTENESEYYSMSMSIYPSFHERSTICMYGGTSISIPSIHRDIHLDTIADTEERLS
ncbi:hypothetical protein FA13DRAFT_1749425 [Coprinellus micaceus]|uniref:Uncharacterized protein n=1 Tax=Coprinellus micaceus TaxID=71717 RepID=A0A4Y7RLW3_COPMI|nr:hypothetical protein FA13DRAFT_1749425 [Coprinellus micaceus]